MSTKCLSIAARPEDLEPLIWADNADLLEKVIVSIKSDVRRANWRRRAELGAIECAAPKSFRRFFAHFCDSLDEHLDRLCRADALYESTPAHKNILSIALHMYYKIGPSDYSRDIFQHDDSEEPLGRQRSAMLAALLRRGRLGLVRHLVSQHKTHAHQLPDLGAAARTAEEFDAICHAQLFEHTRAESSPVNWLFFLDHAPAIRRCLETGGALEARDADGNTPLLFALRQNNGLRSRALVEAGADLCAVNKEGNSALHLLAANFSADTDGELAVQIATTLADSTLATSANVYGLTPAQLLKTRPRFDLALAARAGFLGAAGMLVANDTLDDSDNGGSDDYGSGNDSMRMVSNDLFYDSDEDHRPKRGAWY